MANFLKRYGSYTDFKYGTQNDFYTTHGDIWDWCYLDYYRKIAEKFKKSKSRFLPWTLEIGTWHKFRDYPKKIFSKEGLFNLDKKSRRISFPRYRNLLRDFVLLTLLKEKVLKNYREISEYPSIN